MRMRKVERMTRAQLLAAEIFKYSFANYQDHLGIGNERFEHEMPRTAELLERAVIESWPLARLARELKTDQAEATEYLDAYHHAVAVVDAENPAEAFRRAVQLDVRDAVNEGLRSTEDVERLVKQICYRAADLSYLLDLEGQPLSRYSRHLRREPEVEYYDGYFEEGGH
jgi:hypothetical protein